MKALLRRNEGALMEHSGERLGEEGRHFEKKKTPPTVNNARDVATWVCVVGSWECHDTAGSHGGWEAESRRVLVLFMNG